MRPLMEIDDDLDFFFLKNFLGIFFIKDQPGALIRYLYPAGRLFFWEREEEQVEHERFDALFMNLWDVRRTLGLGSLFFR